MQVTKYRVVKVLYGLKGEADHTFFLNRNGNWAYANPQRDACLYDVGLALQLTSLHQRLSNKFTAEDGQARKVWMASVSYFEANNDNYPLT